MDNSSPLVTRPEVTDSVDVKLGSQFFSMAKTRGYDIGVIYSWTRQMVTDALDAQSQTIILLRLLNYCMHNLRK